MTASNGETAPEVPESLWSEGLPGAIDGGVEPGFEALIKRIVNQRGRVLERCAELYREWAELPNVTLPQAVWLLLQSDPWAPIASAEEPDKSYLPDEHARLVNRLECYVGRELEPLKPYLATFAPRFRLCDVVRVAYRYLVVRVRETAPHRLPLIVPEALEVLREIIEASGQDTGPKGQSWKMIVEERMRFHHQVIEVLRDQGRVEGILPKPKCKSNRRPLSDVTPLDVAVVGMRRDAYCKLFRELWEKAKEKGLPAHDGPLIDDLRALNVSFGKGGRPRGSIDTRPRRRAAASRKKKPLQ